MNCERSGAGRSIQSQIDTAFSVSCVWVRLAKPLDRADFKRDSKPGRQLCLQSDGHTLSPSGVAVTVALDRCVEAVSSHVSFCVFDVSSHWDTLHPGLYERVVLEVGCGSGGEVAEGFSGQK